jgi:glutamine amidotransferase
MCEIFGYCAKQENTINDYLKEFFKHSKEHPHGWGLACFDDGEALIEKEPMQATKSYYLKERLSQPIEYKTVMAHIRYATIGNVEYVNCHPYTKKDNTGRRWTLIHNGTIFDFPPLYKYIKCQKGDTDSERILLFLVDKINEAEKSNNRKLTGEERFQILDCFISNMSKGNKLNLLIYDGEYIYAHTNYRGSLSYLQKGEEIVFSTKPLTNEDWKLLPLTTLHAYKEGKKAFVGTNHGNEYVDNEENMKLLYQMFSNL